MFLLYAVELSEEQFVKFAFDTVARVSAPPQMILKLVAHTAAIFNPVTYLKISKVCVITKI